MVQIAMTSIRSLSVASANIRSPQQPRALKKHPVFSCYVHPSTTFPTHRLPTSPAFQRSNLPKSAKRDEAGGKWEWSVEGESAVANGRNSPN